MKTLIVIDNLNTGGIASSLFNYLYYVHEVMECSLLVFNDKNINISEIPSNVKIIKSTPILRILGISQKCLIKESKKLALLRVLLIIISRIINGQVARKILLKFINNIKGYDLAISYAHDDSWKSLSKGCNDFVAYKVNAKCKATFIHCDYLNFGGYNYKQLYTYKKFDLIVSVSKSCKKNFIKAFPELEMKCTVCENFINIDKVNNLSINPKKYPNESINFLTICRLSIVKGLNRAINAFYKLKNNGFKNFTWTIVGNGPEYIKLKRKILKLGLQTYIKLVGEDRNPYQYIKNSSAFLLTSFHEAAPIVYGESASLGVPILTTETCSARELVEYRNIGIVFENSEEGIYEMLYNVLSKRIILKNMFNISNIHLNYFAKEQFNNFFVSVQKLINF